MMKEFTHTDEKGVRMVDVGSKPVVRRTATAEGHILLREDTINLIREKKIEKGNVLATAQIAAIVAVKRTWEIIPLCHPLPLTGVDVEFDLDDDRITARVTVRCDGKTGVEMEAVTGVSVALLTIWDMVKSVEKDDDGQYPETAISNIRVIKKEKLEL
ncbi:MULTISPECIES: cyclic pyranopterin monophosphate synthase MoaC [Methanothermobacter]|uniref:cyclic pyranopterin monophosphate synthase MoaC n=1 Tax=Methanothermobacter TaxID=145260 RepID=UPI001930BBD9|nr:MULTISPECIES: cyclic pyranopterin monophosphate synthase MoaC [Methanothermobacter]MDI6818987.1 cyclic pyranopterin monophosphate synthase MoaC [Methanothermobacter thermautotrophicus]